MKKKLIVITIVLIVGELAIDTILMAIGLIVVEVEIKEKAKVGVMEIDHMEKEKAKVEVVEKEKAKARIGHIIIHTHVLTLITAPPPNTIEHRRCRLGRSGQIIKHSVATSNEEAKALDVMCL